MSTLREFELALQRDPTLHEPYLALRQAYREAGKWDKLVTLYEVRAQAIEDGPKASELFYLAAEVRLDHLNDAHGAEADLAHAVDRDPDNAKAAQRLKLIYREQGRLNDYMTTLEVEAAALGRAKDPARIAELLSDLNQFCRDSLGRLERAIGLPAGQRQNEVTHEDLKLVESARKIYRAVGDYQNVVRLFELELGLTADAKRRTNLLLGLGRVLGEKLGDLEGAAQRLGEVVRLRPRDDKALEALAAVYANPRWLGADGRERAAATYYQVARRRQEAGDVENAVIALRKALAAVPGHHEASELIEHVLYAAARLSDLDLYYRERVAEAASVEEKMDFLFKRAQLAEGDLGDPAEALRVYEEIVGIEPPGGPASQRLAELYTARQDYAKLAELREKQLETAGDQQFRLSLLTELGTLYRERLGDPEQAAVYWHAILQDNPSHPEALSAYGEHFRQRGDWLSLVDTLEYSFEHARGAGAPIAELLGRLEEIAVICERNLSDQERALSAWQRMEELSPGHDRAHEAQKRILQKGKQWDRMAVVLEREAVAATDLGQRVDILRRLARIQVEKLGSVDKAIAVYRQILGADPKDTVAVRALLDLFEQGERWAELAALLRGQLDAMVTKQEKVGALRRLLVLYHERLGDLAEGSWAAAEILKFVPGDRDALERLEAILERSNDKERLVQMLEYHTRYASGLEEKLRLAHRIADLLHNQIGDGARAVPWWEEILRLAPGDAQALDALAAGYEQGGRAAELGRILELQIAKLRDDPVNQAASLRRLARLAADVLREEPRAQKAWEDLLRLSPSDPEALDALSAIYTAKGDWRTLVGVLERRIPLASEPAAAVALALERARIFEEELKIRSEAIRALEQIVGELDPRCLPAYERLRRLAESGGDWARVVAVVDKLFFLSDDPAAKTALALEMGELWRDRLGDPAKAMVAFERAIELDPASQPALGALSVLYAEAHEWRRLVSAGEKLLGLTQDPAERRRLMCELAETAKGPLEDPKLAFDWYRRAYNEAPDAETLEPLETVAQQHRLWDDLIQVYEGARSRAKEPAAELGLSLKIARICEESLRNPARAFAVLRDALASEPAGTTLVPELERLAPLAREWKGLLDVYARVARGRPAVEERIELLRRRAHVREQNLNNPSGALDEYLRAFALAPEREATRLEILRLAEATRRWEDALNVEAQLFGRAAAVEQKVEIACRAAALVEDRVRNRLRAFRAYLNAFRLAPENETIIAHLWRLAAAVEREDTAEEMDAADLLEDVEDGEGQGALESDDGEQTLEEGEQELTDADTEIEASLPPPPPGAGAPPPPPPSAPRLSTWAELAQAYERLPAADTATRHRFLRKIAEIWERGAKDIDRALETLERAFRLDTDDAVVRNDLRRIAVRDQRWDTVCAIFLRAAEDAPRDEAVRLHHDVARFRMDLGQRDLAEQQYRAVLLLKADDQDAMDVLEDLLRTQELWDDLASMLEKRTTGAVEALPPGERRRRKSAELAELYEKRLERPYEAIDTLERYVGSADEDERGADHPDVVLESCAALDSLGHLYERVGLWSKAVTALQREIDVVGDPPRLRELRWRIAEIHERELRQPDLAIAAYEAILTAAADDREALVALDRLLDREGRHEGLQDVLRKRAEIAEGAERAELIRRRARILEEKLANPDAAAASLRSLGAEALRDDETASALLRNLARAGLGHEALRLLGQRIEMLTADKASPQKLVALQLEAAKLRLDQLDDPTGAREAVEAALKIAPEDPSALAALARLYLRRNEFAAYAETRAREGEALKGQPEAAEAFVDAARVFRDQVGDAARARRCFERALEIDSRNVESLRALAAMLAAEGQLGEARALFERQLDLVDDPTAKAAVLTDLARTIWEKPGDAPAAVECLDEALLLAPDYLPAVVTMADIYYKEQQWSEAERRLLQVVRRMRGQPTEMAQLYHRLGEVYDKLGRLDDGYRQLLEADRMAPGQVLIRLALGENRFHAKRWREAASYLENVAEHPDAHLYPQEVAQALSHAAQAELRQKRPERAVALYESALRINPDHRPSLRAMADLAIERGEKRTAALHLRRLADGSGDRAERATLLEQLGDILHAVDDSDGARGAYEEALGYLGTPTEAHVPLLEKTLSLQRAAGSAKRAAVTAEALIALVTDPKLRAARRREAALLLEEQGEYGRAGEFLEQALSESPGDEAVLASLASAYERAGRRLDLEAILGRTLPTLEPVPAGDVKARSQRAMLWEKLGELHSGNDRAAAITALETAVAVEPGRVHARELLGELYGNRPEHAAAALANHRMLVASDITRASSLRTVARAYAAQGRLDWARCCLELMDLLGLTDDEDKEFLDAHAPPPRKPEDPYATTVEDADHARSLAHPDARTMAEVFAAIWEGVPGLAGPSLESMGVGASDKVSPLSDVVVAQIFGQTAKALGNRRATLYVSPKPDFDGLTIAVSPPPSIVVGQNLAEAPAAELRFLVGRALELTRPEYILGAAMPAKDFTQLFASVLKAFHPRHGRWRPGAQDAAVEQASRLKKSLPYKVAKRLVELFQENGTQPFSSAHWRAVVQETGNRAGLVMCGDLATAAAVILRETRGPDAGAPSPELFRELAEQPGPLRELLRYAVSEDYFSLRASLGTAVVRAAAAE